MLKGKPEGGVRDMSCSGQAANSHLLLSENWHSDGFSIRAVSHTSSVAQPAVTSPCVPDGLPQTQLKGLLVQL